MSSSSSLPRVVIVPGNGEGCEEANFYPWLASQLSTLGFVVTLSAMPLPNAAPSDVWQSFLLETLNVDSSCILVGHSSGACAVLRLAEKNTYKAVIAVSITDNDLGDRGERESGWYDSPWLWSKMRENTNHLVVFASDDDPFIPVSVQRRVGKFLADVESTLPCGNFEYIELKKRSHFFGLTQQEILDAVIRCSSTWERGKEKELFQQ
jgi:uncharacterized protein